MFFSGLVTAPCLYHFNVPLSALATACCLFSFPALGEDRGGGLVRHEDRYFRGGQDMLRSAAKDHLA